MNEFVDGYALTQPKNAIQPDYKDDWHFRILLLNQG